MVFRIFMWIVMLLGGIIGGYYLDNIWFKGIHQNFLFHLVSFAVGVFLLSVVMRISKNTGRTLARYGRKGELKRMETNVLVKEGVYRYMRHPMHLGLLLFPLSFAFLTGSPSFIFIISPAEMLLMLLLIKLIEEPEAVRKFGDEYREYMKQVPRFCFRKECLKELFKKVRPNKK